MIGNDPSSDSIVTTIANSNRCELEGDLRHSRFSLPRLEGKLCHACLLHKFREATRLAHPSPAPHRNALSRVFEAKNKIY